MSFANIELYLHTLPSKNHGFVDGTTCLVLGKLIGPQKKGDPLAIHHGSYAEPPTTPLRRPGTMPVAHLPALVRSLTFLGAS